MIAILSGLAAATASAAPTIAELRAQVARIQSEVSAIDTQVEAAAEAYNGAVWRLGEIQTRIEKNRVTLTKARRDLRRAQTILGKRLRAAYIQPPPSRIQLILSSRSVSSMVGGAEALERASQQDAAIVTSVKALRDRTLAARKQLLRDRTQAKTEVSRRAEQRAVVLRLLDQRQAVLSRAKGRLGAVLAAERARQARAAAAEQRALALARSRTTAGVGSGADLGSGAVVSGSGSAANAEAARIALRYLGVPYVWGGASPSGFDCSGLASYAFAKVGKSVPHYTGAIWAKFPRVVGPLQPGDLVFFHGLGHMGIYIGSGQMVHAPHTGDVVRVASMASRSGSYVGAVRP